MTTTWTGINKPNGTGYTAIPKPLGTSSVITKIFSGGLPIGLLLALTQSSVIGQSSVVTSLWTDIQKANNTVYIDVPKAT